MVAHVGCGLERANEAALFQALERCHERAAARDAAAMVEGMAIVGHDAVEELSEANRVGCVC